MKKSILLFSIALTAVIVYLATLYSFGNCGIGEVPCYRWNQQQNKYDCNCQAWFCAPGWKQGECPNP